MMDSRIDVLYTCQMTLSDAWLIVSTLALIVGVIILIVALLSGVSLLLAIFGFPAPLLLFAVLAIGLAMKGLYRGKRKRK